MDANYYKLFIILKSICPQLSHWHRDRDINSLRIRHTISTVNLSVSMKEVEHPRDPQQAITTKSGRTTLLSHPVQLTGPLRIESTSQIGLEPSQFNLLFLSIV